MVAFSSTSALTALLTASSLITALPTSGIQTSQFTPFNLVTTVTQGNASYGGLQIVGEHSGAAMNLVAAVPESEGNFTVGGYVLNDTYIDINFDIGSNLPPYSLGLGNGGFPLNPNISGAVNQGVNLNGNAGQQTSGFVIDNEGFLCYGGNEFDFQTFTVCGGNVLFGGPPQDDLFWRNTTSTPDLVNCADVRLMVQFP